MKSVNIADLKNKLSAYLELVERGEEIVVRNRKRAVAKIVGMKPGRTNEEESELVLNGELRLPEKEMSKQFLDRFLAAKAPIVSSGTSVEALITDRNED